MPPWNHLHPAIVHFPIALLMAAPLFVLLGLFWPDQRRGLHGSAMVLLVLGLGGALLSLATGEAVERFARRTPELRAAVDTHEHLAQLATAIFAALAVALLVLWLLRLFRKQELSRPLDRGILVLWLLISAWGVLTLARAGHEGGRMVHELYTHAGPEPKAP